MDCSLPGSSLHGIFQARVLEWAAIAFSRGSSRPRDQTQISCIAGRFFTILGWPKSSLIHKMLWKNLKELFGQPNSMLIPQRLTTEYLLTFWSSRMLPLGVLCWTQCSYFGSPLVFFVFQWKFHKILERVASWLGSLQIGKLLCSSSKLHAWLKHPQVSCCCCCCCCC